MFGIFDTYIICPVTYITDEQKRFLDDHVATLRSEGREVYYPLERKDTMDENIIPISENLLRLVTRVDIYWDINSRGSILAFANAKANENLEEVVLLNQAHVEELAKDPANSIEKYLLDWVKIANQINGH